MDPKNIKQIKKYQKSDKKFLNEPKSSKLLQKYQIVHKKFNKKVQSYNT